MFRTSTLSGITMTTPYRDRRRPAASRYGFRRAPVDLHHFLGHQPKSPSNMPQKGPEAIWLNSMTRTPARGKGAAAAAARGVVAGVWLGMAEL